MPPVTSIAKPFAKLITQCPYCDHVSPVGSKFCGECGAALHLMPCPHCGAVNDITVATACYRCHRELREKKIAVTPAKTASPPVDTSPYVIAAPPARLRRYALVVGIILLAFAAASYYAYRQRSLEGRESAPGTSEVKAANPPAEGNAQSGAGTIVKAPAAGPVNAAAPTTATATVAEKAAGAGSSGPAPLEVKGARADIEPQRAATTAPRSAADRPGTVVESAATAAIVTPDSTRARIEASKGLEKQAPYVGPCTDAVAALGLCIAESIPRRQ